MFWIIVFCYGILVKTIKERVYEKIILLISVLSCVFISGCNVQEKRVKSLEKAYIYLIDEIDSNYNLILILSPSLENEVSLFISYVSQEKTDYMNLYNLIKKDSQKRYVIYN